MRDPQEAPLFYIDIAELADGVWFVIDQDGEPQHHLCDAGPWSVKEDAYQALAAAYRELQRLADDAAVEMYLSRVALCA